MKCTPIYPLFLVFLGITSCYSPKPAQHPKPRPTQRPVTQKNTLPAPTNAMDPRPELSVQNGMTDINWINSERLMPVLEEAQRLHKNVFVSFHAVWCAPCKVMEEEIFSQRTVFEMMNEHFINFRTDFDSQAGKTIAQIYEVEKLPTVLFLNPNGVVLQRHLGIATVAELTQMTNAVLANK